MDIYINRSLTAFNFGRMFRYHEAVHSIVKTLNLHHPVSSLAASGFTARRAERKQSFQKGTCV